MTTTPAAANDMPRAQIDLIDGVWSEPKEILDATIDDPNTGRVRQDQRATAASDVEHALATAAALHAAGTLEKLAVSDRVKLLDLIASGLAQRAGDIAYEDAMATGNPLSTTEKMASYLGPRVTGSRDQLLQVKDVTQLEAGGRDVRLLRRPLGPAAILAPWNAPTFVAVAKVASAIAAGCPVLLKPSEWAPGGCQIVAEVIAAAVEDLDLPRAMFQFVHGGATVGAQIASDSRIRAISFTGGAVGGRAVATAAAPHFTALHLELGGHNPVVILSDADIPAAAKAIASGMTKLNGQWCEAPGKVLVPSALHDSFVETLTAELGQLTVGHCLDESTDVGPIAYAAHRDRLSREVSRLEGKGAQIITPCPLPELDGWFMSPTLVVGLRAEESEHELFGPAVTVHAVSSTEEAIAAANGPETGLAGFVFGTDHDAALSTAARLSAGEIRVNGCNLADLSDESEQSFWNNAGIGAHGPTDMVTFFQGRQTVGVDDPSFPI